MSFVLGFVGAALLVGLIALVSLRMTERKSSDELKRRTPDGSSSNDSGANGSYDAMGGGD